MPVISDSLLGVIVGGIIGIVSGILVEMFKRWFMRPKITINEDMSQVDFDLKTYHEPEGHVIQDQHRTRYTGTRIKVENNGRSAAEDCKASLIIKENELRVGWMIRKQDCTVTINADDVEYLDLCAISEDRTALVVTTERGYGDYVDSARRFNVGVIDAKLKVSAKNAKQCIKRIRILNQPDTQNKIVRFTE